ncbi:helix-turn-helix transcriptional regulator [Candidatus Woesearchaeota archaeon]|nr:helix-turn-helix transcriptional regulator [Candidatus Woesearchaeota archaeon]
MTESTPDRVSLELLDKFDEFSERFGGVIDYSRASGLAQHTLYQIEGKLINADLGIRLYTIAAMARPVRRIPFVLRKGPRIARLGNRDLLIPRNYKDYFRAFFTHHAQGFSERELAKRLTDETGVSFAQTTMHYYLHGDSIPDVLRLEAISRFFNHRPEYFVDRKSLHL